MLSNENEPVTLKEARSCDQNSKWEVASQEETKASQSLRSHGLQSHHPCRLQIKANVSYCCKCFPHFKDISILD